MITTQWFCMMKLNGMTEIPVQFRMRRPPRRELYCKLFTLFLFGVFCAVVGLNVALLPLPEEKDVSGGKVAAATDDLEVSVFSTFSPEERAKLAEFSARLSVPYLTPWGAYEKPVLFFMWHLLYRSIRPDLEHFAENLRNASMTTAAPTAAATTTTSTAAAAEVVAHPNAPEAAARKPQIVIHVLETENGYITASLTRFLPEALVFSVVVNSTFERARAYPRYREAINGLGPAVDDAAHHFYTFSPEKRGYAEEVAAKVERVLSNPAAENVTEVTQRPGANQFTVSAVPTMTTEVAEGKVGGDVGVSPPPPSILPSASRLFLCVPTNIFNLSYYTAPATQQLVVNYQVFLSPYIALRAVQSSAEFDAALRAILTRANVASFIVLPLLWDDEVVNAGDEAQLRRAQVFSKELADFDRWYGESEGYPLRILQRALLVPEVESRYHVSLTELGAEQWGGALRQLFRVELTKVEGTANTITSTMTTTTTTTTGSPDDATAVAGTSAVPSTVSPASLFGCAARRLFLQCAPRPQHASCEHFSDGIFA